MYSKNNNSQEIVKTKIFTPLNIITSILWIWAILSWNSILILIVIWIIITNLYVWHKIKDADIWNYFIWYIVSIVWGLLFIIFFPTSLILIIWWIAIFFNNRN